MTVVRADTFTRANVASGFGTATDGNVWTISSGNGQSVATNEGQITGSTASTFATLGAALPGADAEGLVRFAVTDTTHNTAGIILRWTDASNHWLGRFNGAAAGGPAINVMVKVAGTYTSQANIAVTVSIGTFYWLRFRCQGTTISLRFWADGSAEPSTWNGQYTLTSQNVAGAVGLYGFASGSSTTHYDSYSVDNLASAGVALAGEADGLATASAALTTTLAGEADGVATASATLAHSVPLAGASAGVSTAVGSLAAVGPGTGIGNLAVTTKTQTWPNSTTGAGSGTETDVTYTDATGSGWSVGLIPSYGGMPISSWYEVDVNVVGGNQTSLSTTTSDGAIHWLEQLPAGTFGGSEDKAFALTELAPTGTTFRRYYKCVFGPDVDGFNWQGFACIYPGDPGMIAYRFDLINPSASPVTLASTDSMEIALIGGLQQGDTTWAYTNGGYGTLATGNVSPWPVASANGTPVSASPDYVYIAPASGSGVNTGRVTVLQKPVGSLSPAWASAQLSTLVNTSRLKLKVFGTQTTFPASTTSTAYLLWAFRRNLSASDAYAIAADYIAPGTPSVTTGSYTGYSYDERAYTFTPVSNVLVTTLDLSPAHVTVRYKPVLKVTSWTGGAPVLSWGGASLTAGADYRFYLDAANATLYIQLYFDVVTTGAVVGQRNNAPLGVSVWAGEADGVSTASATLAVTHAFVGEADGVSTATAALTHSVPLAGASTGLSTASALASVPRVLTGEADGLASASATLTHSVPLAGEADGVSDASASLTHNVPLAGAAAGVATAGGTLTISRFAGETDGLSTATAALIIAHPLAGEADGVSTANAIVGATTWAGEADGISTAAALLLVAHLFAGVAAGSATALGTLTTGVQKSAGPVGVSIVASGGPAGVAITLSAQPVGVSITEG